MDENIAKKLGIENIEKQNTSVMTIKYEEKIFKIVSFMKLENQEKKTLLPMDKWRLYFKDSKEEKVYNLYPKTAIVISSILVPRILTTLTVIGLASVAYKYLNRNKKK